MWESEGMDMKGKSCKKKRRSKHKAKDTNTIARKKSMSAVNPTTPNSQWTDPCVSRPDLKSLREMIRG